MKLECQSLSFYIVKLTYALNSFPLSQKSLKTLSGIKKISMYLISNENNRILLQFFKNLITYADIYFKLPSLQEWKSLNIIIVSILFSVQLRMLQITATASIFNLLMLSISNLNSLNRMMESLKLTKD